MLRQARVSVGHTNREALNSTRIHGTHVPVEEPTARWGQMAL